MTQLISFIFQHVQVRAILREGGIWFVAWDVCRALGVLDASSAITGMEAKHKRRMEVPPHGEVTIIAESGAYDLAMIVDCGGRVFDRQPGRMSAAFREFVRNEVAPAIFPKTVAPAALAVEPRPAVRNERARIEELLPVVASEVDGEAQPTVNARELHKFLGVGRDFTSWIKGRIDQYGFVEHRDFEVFSGSGRNGDGGVFAKSGENPQGGNGGVFPRSGENPQGGRPSKEYAISMRMAQHLAMVENNDRGREARDYFIDCERRAKEAASKPAPRSAEVAAEVLQKNLNDPDFLRPLLLTYTEKVIALQAEVKEKDQRIEALAEKTEEMAADVEALDRLTKADGTLSITESAKAIGILPKKLFEAMARGGWIYRRPQGGSWLGYSSKCKAGHLSHNVTTVLRPDGTEKIVEQVRVTPKGLAALTKQFALLLQ